MKSLESEVSPRSVPVPEDCDEFGPDERPPQVPRFDGPAVKLEIRGTTQQQTEHNRQIRLELHQQLLWSKATIHKNTTAAKLRSVGESAWAEKLEKCHTIYTICQCTACGNVQKFPNRCDQMFCAECQPRLAHERRRAVEWWTHEISQPKHVVLTVQNLPHMDKLHVVEFKRWFKNLRRSKFARNWIGGFYSIEVTKEVAGTIKNGHACAGGWHLHLHALINAKWIDALALSAAWEQATRGFGKIVKVKDARQGNYLAEVTKYAVKGVQLAAWTPSEIQTFIKAFDGVRTFGVFGSLYGLRTQFAEWFKIVRDQKPKCDCGCSQMNYFSEAQWLEMDLRPAPQTASLPPPQVPHPELFGARTPEFPRD